MPLTKISLLLASKSVALTADTLALSETSALEETLVMDGTEMEGD